VYDMYPWNGSSESVLSRGDGSGSSRAEPIPPDPPGAPPRDWGDGPSPQTPLGAVQFALDRRDNGGEAAAASEPAADLSRQ
jgi:hypothetical protein